MVKPVIVVVEYRRPIEMGDWRLPLCSEIELTLVRKSENPLLFPSLPSFLLQPPASCRANN